MISKNLENEINENFTNFIKWKRSAYRKNSSKNRTKPPVEIWEKLKLLQDKYPNIDLKEHFPVTQTMWNRHVLGIKAVYKKKNKKIAAVSKSKKKSVVVNQEDKPFVLIESSKSSSLTEKAEPIAFPLLTLELKNGTRITVYQ